MKKFITPTYTFTPGASGVGTVDLSGISGFDKKNLVSIINQTRGVIIYATGSTALRYTNVTGTVVTLFYDTTTQNNADILQVIYEDNSAIAVSGSFTSPVNSNGSNTDSTVSTVATLTPPANSVGFILMNLDTSTASIRWRIGATATASSGQQLQVGRDTGFIPCAANISICSESGTNNYNIQWILSS